MTTSSTTRGTRFVPYLREKQIEVAVCGGLGNQLFQYAAGRAASVTLNAKLALDISFFEGTQRGDTFGSFRRSCRLNDLHTVFDKLTSGRSTNEIPPYGLFKRVSRRIGIRQKQLPAEVTDTEWKSWDAVATYRSVRLHGYWMSPKFFAGIERALRTEITPKSEAIQVQVSGLLSKHRQPGKPLVGVHVRRGDVAFAHETLKNGIGVGYRLLSLDYYRKAMAYFSDVQFLVFSDDPDWVTRQFQGENVSVAGSNPELVDFFSLVGCDHQIIANSTFSWWAAWLNGHPNKQVVAPENWYVDGYPLTVDSRELLPNEWIRVAV